MKTYETVIILDDRKVQDEGKAFIEEFSSAVSRANGEFLRATPLGRKQFARQIKKKKSGFFWDVVFNMNEKEVAEIPDKYRLDERILRLQIFIYDRPEDPREEKINRKTVIIKDDSGE